MNKERILALADAIEVSENYNQAHYFSHCGVLGAIEHDEKTSTYTCNTPGCVAGHAIALFATQEDLDHLYFFQLGTSLRKGYGEIASSLLGLTLHESSVLFAPRAYDFCEAMSFHPTAKEATATLRNFAKTGKIRWTQEAIE